MLQAEVHVKLLSESPRGTFDEIRDRVRGLQGFQVDGGHVLHLQIGELGLPEGVASVWHLGGGSERTEQGGQQAKGGQEGVLHRVGFQSGSRQGEDVAAPPQVARWGRKAEIRRASP